jgi:hypothetical protein
MARQKTINVGIGFATGRKSFQKVLKTYIYNWLESGLVEKENVKLNVFVAYDLRYQNTRVSDYTNVRSDLRQMIDGIFFIGKGFLLDEINLLIRDEIITKQEADLFFGSGYAAKRNSVLYAAIKNNMDYLLYLDDDEYPLAVTNSKNSLVWGGQHVLLTHLQHIKNADITYGHHCGYVSPIPYIEFNDTLSEDTFRTFIEALSNDIISWDKVSAIMREGGVTYADTKILTTNPVTEVAQINHAKFISGSNLCLNLTRPSRVAPFYNPPGARGEDTFLSTGLMHRQVLRVPCYTFHDGFSTYNHLMDGVLPIKLKYISTDLESVVKRFYAACVGWIRYKPLFMYITDPENYEQRIYEMRQRIALALPQVCAYFHDMSFMSISRELEHYHNNVKKHYAQFQQTQQIWQKIVTYLGVENSL